MTGQVGRRRLPADLNYGRSMNLRVCKIAGEPNWVDEIRYEATAADLPTAVARDDPAVLFEWLIGILSHQGISDAVADGFIAARGNVRWADIDHDLKRRPACLKLAGYWAFVRCRYNKAGQTCDQV